MAASHPATWDDDELLAHCTLQRTRRSGPGGQHRNKVETAVVITFEPTGLRAEASERRSQEENRRMALRRLRRALARSIRRPIEHTTPPSPAWLSRLGENKQVTVSAAHPDFPGLLAEALDVLEIHQLAPAAAARQLGCSTSQLCRLIALDPAAWQQTNTRRQTLGLPPLRRRR